MSATTGAADFNNGGLATGAGGTLLAKDFEELGEVSDITIAIYKMLKCCTSNLDRFVHDRAG